MVFRLDGRSRHQPPFPGFLYSEFSMFRTLVRSTALAAIVVFSACDDSSGPSTSDATLIVSGVPITGISGGENSRRYYRIVVPTGATRLRVRTEGGAGDVDLLVRHNRLPTLLDSDCESFNFGNEDECDRDDPVSGDWYIMLFGAEDGYENATLTATVTSS
jgi:hypothetical protein